MYILREFVELPKPLLKMSLADFPKSEYEGGTAIVPEETDMHIIIKRTYTLYCINPSKCIIKGILQQLKNALP